METAKPAISRACRFCTEIFNKLETEKSSSQHKPHKINVAVAKNAIALIAIGCKLAIHPRREDAMHPAIK